MSILRAQTFMSSSFSSSSTPNNQSRRFHATLQPVPKQPAVLNTEKLGLEKDIKSFMQTHTENKTLSKLYTIKEAVADRVEMHSIIGHQRNDWNKLFLTSINSITLTASLLAAISSMNHANELLNVAPTILFSSATMMMLLINKLQPSQLSEEQTKATQLFKQLENSILSTIAIGTPAEQDVEEFVQKVLAIDKAYPLPLLPLLEKFPKKVEGARWWPVVNRRSNGNSRWTGEVKEVMRGVLRVMKEKDRVQYQECAELAVRINKILAVTGPLMAAVAAVGASQISNGTLWAVLVATVGGALATVVNTLEHGGQIGMIFELFRNNVGYFKNLEEEIESNLGSDLNDGENGELFLMKMALSLGRSLPELKSLASYASDSTVSEEIEEFASKLFDCDMIFV